MFLLLFEGRAHGRGFHQVCVLDAANERAATELLAQYLVKNGVALIGIDSEESRSVTYEKLSAQLRSSHAREDGVMAMSGRIWFDDPKAK